MNPFDDPWLYFGLLGGLILANLPAWAINRTSWDLRWMLEMIEQAPETEYVRIRFLLEPSFNRHLWRRVTFRSPWPLYSPELRAVLRK